MQNYIAQGPIVKGRQQSVRVYCENMQSNEDVLRSNFSGTEFPKDPVIGQHCFREDVDIEYIYTANGWVEVGGAQGELIKELNGARGTHDSLTSRLDVSLNPDGTLKANVELNVDEWKVIDIVATFVDRTRFTVADDMTKIFTAHRAIKVSDNVNTKVTFVESSSYMKAGNVTTVIVRDAVLPEKINSIKVGMITDSIPDNVALKSDLKETDVKTNGFESHVASGLGIDIDARTGKPKVNTGRAFVAGRYEDLEKELVADSLPAGKNLLYAEAKSNGGLEIKSHQFINPVLMDGIKHIPTDDLLFMTDYGVEDETEARGLIKDLTGKGCHLQPAGGDLTEIGTITPISWMVPNPPIAGAIHWDSAEGALKAIQPNKTWSVMHCFIPRGQIDDTKKNAVLFSAGSAFHFELSDYESSTETYAVGFETTGSQTLYSGAAVKTKQLFPVRIHRNEPCMVVLESTGENVKFYINGHLALVENGAYDFNGFTDLTVHTNTSSTSIPLFSCIRHGSWNESEVAEMANQMGISNEHLGYNMQLPELFHGIASDEYGDKYHAWLMNERSGNAVYDINKKYAINGIAIATQRKTTAVKDNEPSIDLGYEGSIEFDRLSLDKEFSFFTFITPYTDGTIAANAPSAGSGFVFGIKGGSLTLTLDKAYTTTAKIAFGQPSVVGFVIKNNEIKMFADSLTPYTNTFAIYNGYSDNNQLFLGYDGNKANKLNAIYHVAIMAHKAFSDAEVRQIFKALKHTTYKNILSDNAIASSAAALGMVKVDNYGVAEQIETYPRWGRKKNPYKSKKYFLGWYNVKAGPNYYVPNYYGSSRVKLNLYAKVNTTDGVIKPLPTEFTVWNGTAATGGMNHLHITDRYIGFRISSFPEFVSNIAEAEMPATPGSILLGFEVEPMADDADFDSFGF